MTTKLTPKQFEIHINSLETKFGKVDLLLDDINVFTPSDIKIAIYHTLGKIAGQLYTLQMMKKNQFFEVDIPKELRDRF